MGWTPTVSLLMNSGLPLAISCSGRYFCGLEQNIAGHSRFSGNLGH